jgi:hypothetical protein
MSQEGDGTAGHTTRLNPMTLGHSLAAARNLILNQGSTWGAYQHYGQPNARIFIPEQPAEWRRTPRSTRKPTAARAKPKPKTKSKSKSAGRAGKRAKKS